MTESETPVVTVVFGPEAGLALGQSLGAALKDSLGLAIADALMRLQSARIQPIATTALATSIPSAGTLSQPLEQDAQNDGDVARKSLETLREISALLRQPGAAVASSSIGRSASIAPVTTWQPIASDCPQQEMNIFQILSNPLDAVSMAFTSAQRYGQRIQELAVRGGMAPGAASEDVIRSRVEAAAKDSGVDNDAALNMVRLLMNTGLTLERSLDYLPSATKLQYGKAIAPELVAALVKNVSLHGDNDTAGVERSLGVVSWRAHAEKVPVEQLISRLNLGQEPRSWEQILQPPEAMQIEPGAQLQAAVDARKGTGQGQRRSTEITFGGLLQSSGSDALKVLDEGMPALTFAADGLKVSSHLAGSGLAVMSGQFDVSKELLATYASAIGLDSVAERLKSIDLGPLKSPATTVSWIGEQLTGASGEASSTLQIPDVHPLAIGRAMRNYWKEMGFGPAAPPLRSPARQPLRPRRASAERDDVQAAQMPTESLMGAMLGGWSEPVLGSVMGKLAEWGEKTVESKRATIDATVPVPGSDVVTPGPSALLNGAAPTSETWTFSPQISINVAGNVSDPEQLANELLPRLRQMLADFSQDRQRDALFDMVVV